MFRGRVNTTIDDKGRIVMPSRFRKDISSKAKGKFVITYGRNKCLWLYPFNAWLKLEARIAAMDSLDADAVELRRAMLDGSEDCKIDSQFRILFKDHALQYAGIEKDILMIGQLERIEVWSPEVYAKYKKDNNVVLETAIDKVLKKNSN